jgi:hypothetical protein
MRHFLQLYGAVQSSQCAHGPFFQGRFKSLLNEADDYLLPLSRSIHLNPNRTRQFKTAGFREKLEYLKAYLWSSFAGFYYLRKANKMIDYVWLLSRKPSWSQAANLRNNFVESGTM